MSNFTEDHKRAFEALKGGRSGNFALFACFCDGRPAAAIVAVYAHPSEVEGGETEYGIPSPCR